MPYGIYIEWVIYILDVWKDNNKPEYLNFATNIINDWLNNFRVPNDYNSKLIWCDHAVSCRISVFLNIYNTLKTIKKESMLKHDMLEVLNEHSFFLLKWTQKNQDKVHNHILIAAISLIYYYLYIGRENTEEFTMCVNIVEKYIVSNFIDGINIENSPGYQFHVLVYLIRFFYFVSKINKEYIFTKKMINILEESIPYLQIFKRSNKTVPVIGDSNLTLDIFACSSEKYNNLDTMIEYLTSKKIIKVNNNLISESFKSIIKKETGYIIMLENDIQLIMRYNPITYNWHTHNDQMSINYFRNDIDWITDVGSYPDKRDFCISRIAHNIILRDMENINTIKSKYSLEIINDKNFIMTMITDTFKHKREILWLNKDSFLIKDNVENINESNTNVFNQIFHLNNKIEKIDQESNKVILSYQNNKLIIEQENITELKIYNGSDDPFIGWVCYNAAKLEKTNTLVFNSEKTNKTEFVTKFSFL
jgi:hypothetical protein